MSPCEVTVITKQYPLKYFVTFNTNYLKPIQFKMSYLETCYEWLYSTNRYGSMSTESYVGSLDVGTTTIRCQIINSQTQVVGSASSTVELIYPNPGFFEIDPEQLWHQVVTVIKNAIADARLTPKEIKCLGISTQRSTFTTWRRDTGEPYHNFITWKDIRAKELCKEINASLLMKTFRTAAYSAYLLTRNERYLTGSRLKIAPNHVTGRLLWALRYIPEVKENLPKNNVMFGTVDTWLLYKFTDKKLYVTDISNASATGFYDPFVVEWSSWSKFFLGVPHEILPTVVDNDYEFGSTVENIFKVPLPIRCVMADQSSSMIASCCLECDDIKVTLGTGAFLDVNTADKIHTSVTGIYPLIGWKLNNKMICIGEVACNDCGSLMQWLLNGGFIKDPSDSFQIATSIESSDGIYFIPAFSGLGPPINDPEAGSGFLGIKPTTTKKHLVRAVLEGMTYRVALAYKTLKRERKREYKKVTVDGGVSKNDFVCQLLADLTGICVERLVSSEMSVLGVGFIAGVIEGIWKSSEQLQTFKKVDKLFMPNDDDAYRNRCIENFNKWLEAVERFKSWYKEE